jgi:hypothetical protein
MEWGEDKETGMSALTFCCPRSGQTIRTGIETDEHTFAAVKTLSMRVRCAHCGGEHEFSVAEGQLAEAA